MGFRRPRLPGIARAAGALALAVACAAAAARAGESEDGAPFELSALPLPGRPLEAWAIATGGRGARLVVASAEGSPPDERRHLAVFAPSLEGRGVTQEIALALPAGAVAFDVAALAPGGPTVLALLFGDRLVLLPLGAQGAPERTIPLPAALPLPPPTRGFLRVPFVGGFDGRPGPSALVPALGGLLLVRLDGGAARPLDFPLYAFYYGGDDGAGVRPGPLQSFVTWPEVARGDDDGDGRADLLAFSRYDLAVYRTGPEGLPGTPSRRVVLRPFDAEEELRYLATSVSLFARDLDADGLVDLVQHRTFGTLLRSHATTSVWRNPGGGADPTAPPDVQLEGRGGFGSIFLEDLDGDGRLEAVQLLVPFGAVQLVRAVLTDTVQSRLRVFRLTPPDLAADPVFADDVTIAVETREGRVAGILPTVAGDFDADGLRDLAFGESLVELAVRRGVRGSRGPGFGPVAARQTIPAADRAVVGDFDGDGLDDVAAIDTRAERGVALLRNRGTLARSGELRAPPPATPPELRPAEPPGSPGATPE